MVAPLRTRYWLAADAWGLGYATEAASAMVDYAFKTRRLSAIERVLEGMPRQHVSSRNSASLCCTARRFDAPREASNWSSNAHGSRATAG